MKTNPLATARQLWRLNKEGRLALVEAGATPIPSEAADAAIREGVEAALEAFASSCAGLMQGGEAAEEPSNSQ